ncbi:MAG: phosphate signaling complex protein PhoU [Verrucomicrobiales bacterium]|jgi:phosphate transport system protein|nr:phosphate signaling complex protein PhoU [Verrucomicrobiales bacterium]
MSEEIPHTLSEFEDGLKNVKESVLVMASMAAVNLESAVKGVLDRNEDLCNKAIVDDTAVNHYERKIDEMGLEIIYRFNPVATDLRIVASSMKIATNLERIADEAENIGRRGKKMAKKEEVPEVLLIEPLADQALSMLKEAAQAFSEGNVELALGLYEQDQALDAAYKKTVKKLTRRMEEDVANLKSYLNLIFISRCIERVGDHAQNIGEDVVYINSGEDIRHVGPTDELLES